MKAQSHKKTPMINASEAGQSKAGQISSTEGGQIKRSPQGGQIIVEYVLLLSIALTAALIIVSQLVKRDSDDPQNSGALIRKWQQMQETISKDVQN